ncbi:MAG TPA: EamA family transporter, partial [Aestuariivirga sp.]|nr:EamA family transporter [Aestuariivirga sp.]
ERPPFRFWLACAIGVGAVIVFAVNQGGGAFSLADGWLALAMLSVGVAYVEGGRVSRELGGTTTLCWAMIVLAPLAAIPLSVAIWQRDWAVSISAGAWIGFWYAGVVSMFLGSIAWYRGLAAGGIARIGQSNLLQPLLALLWSALLIGERVTGVAVACALVVVAAMVVCLRSRISVVAPSS